MAPRWTRSSGKHGIPRAEIAYAITSATYQDVLEGESSDDGEVHLYIGHPHPQALPDDELEVLVNVYDDGREAVIFHAMRLGPMFRRYREENPR